MNKLLLVPSARCVPTELEADFGRISPAMLPLDSRPALHYIATPFAALGYRTLVAVDEEPDAVLAYIDHHPELAAEAAPVGATQSLGETVYSALLGLDSMPDHLVINFADTIVTDSLDAERTEICCQELAEPYRWTVALIDDDGAITDIVDKDRAKPRAHLHNVFVGVFGIVDVEAFRLALEDALSFRRRPHVDPFYEALWRHYNDTAPARRRIKRVDGWRDLGHLDTYYETKRTFFLGKRFFNEVQIDARRGSLRKTSDDADKLNREIAWYVQLPRALQHVAPRLFDYRIDSKHPFVELEYYGYPALSDTYLYGRRDVGTWHGIFDAIGHLLDEMARFPGSSEAEERQAAAREMYETKTARRVEQALADPRLGDLIDGELVINGRPCEGLKSCLAALDDVAARVGLFDIDSFCVVHGDLCLSNMLFDPRNRLLRVIDPRGSFGDFDIHGDPAYDLAKLCHSIEGDYDFLLNGLFDLSCEDREIRLDVRLNDEQMRIRASFGDWIRARCGESYARVKLIESLLFFSMLPLHADRPASQRAFLVRGLETFARVRDEVGASIGRSKESSA